jgi:6-phosphogluconolactonase
LAAASDPLVLFGTREDAIMTARLDAATGRLTALGTGAELKRPTWILASPHAPVVYAVNDDKQRSTVRSFSVDPQGRLSELSRVDPGGTGPTFLADDPASHTLFVANYDDGRVSALPIAKGGLLGPPTSGQADRGSGPSPRQQGPHAHSVALAPGGRFLIAADFGADRLFVYPFDPATRHLGAAIATVALPAGSGPRHLVAHPGGRFLFLVSELAGTVTPLRWNATTHDLTTLQPVSVYPDDHAGPASAAEIALSNDGTRLYVSTRGDDNIVLFAVDPGTGALSFRQRTASGGNGPWSFAFAPDNRWLLVANSLSNEVAVLPVDPTDGLLGAPVSRLSVPSPSSIAFMR